MLLRKQPFVVGHWPVWKAARAGPQTGWQVTAEARWVPRSAMRSKFGVRPIGLPCRDDVSKRCWSVKNTITLLFGTVGPAWP